MLVVRASHHEGAANGQNGNCLLLRNCGAFLKITARTLKNEAVEPIDSARIEPLSYKLAFQIARQAVGSNGGGPEQDIIDAGKAMSRPEMVEAVNLEVCPTLRSLEIVANVSQLSGTVLCQPCDSQSYEGSTLVTKTLYYPLLPGQQHGSKIAAFKAAIQADFRSLSCPHSVYF